VRVESRCKFSVVMNFRGFTMRMNSIIFPD
jgi:hypothetical protein